MGVIRLILLSYLLILTGLVLTAQRSVSTPLRLGTKEIEKREFIQNMPLLYVFESRSDIPDGFLSEVEVLRIIDDHQMVIALRSWKVLSPSYGHFYQVSSVWKCSESILSLKKHEKTSYLVQTISSDNEIVRRIIADYELKHVHGDIYQGKGRLQQILELSQYAEVRFISKESTTVKEESRVIDLNLTSNNISKVHALHPQFKGSGMVMGIKEESFDPLDLDLIGRRLISGLENSEISQHATEVATILVGAGNSFVTGLGVAPEATITSTSFEDLFPDDSRLLDSLNVYIQNHSYGTMVENEYAAYDHHVFDNPKRIHVFSIGNSGLEIPESGPYAGIGTFANLTGNFKTAKNIITVGAVDTLGKPLEFSSRGPSFDGRVRPDLSAYSMVGSSNAAALVSGTSLLLQEQYLKKYGELPDFDLIRAMMIAGATDVGNSGPDYHRGFGVLDASNSAEVLVNEWFQERTSNAGHTQEMVLHLTEEVSHAKVVLTWVDPPANVGDAHALVNDLDLMIKTPVGDSLFPWILSHEANVSALNRAAVRSTDHLNTIEVVSFDTNIPGDYTIVVNAENMGSVTQKYSIAYHLDSAGRFEWDYPQEGSIFPYNGETGTYFKWSTSLNQTYGNLYWRYIDDVEWKSIKSNILLHSKLHRWNEARGLEDGIIEAMMVIDSDTFLTKPFILSTLPQVNVNFNCGDSLMLSWSKSKTAKSYRILQPREQFLETIVTVKDTFLILKTPENPLFSILPENQYPYLPAYTFNYLDQGSGCFVRSFYQEQVTDEGIFLDLKLSSVYGIDSLTIHSLLPGENRLIYHSSSPKQSVKVLDTNPTQGLNEHLLTLYFNNGQQLSSIATGTFYLTETPVIVFPNPVSVGGLMSFFTRDFEGEAQLFIYDKNGALFLSRTLYSSRESIAFNNLKPGVYFYQILLSDDKFYGKIIME